MKKKGCSPLHWCRWMELAYSESESDSGSDKKVELNSKVLAMMKYSAASIPITFFNVVNIILTSMARSCTMVSLNANKGDK
jgi:hypothetical protein